MSTMNDEQKGWGAYTPPASAQGDQFFKFANGKNKFRIIDGTPIQGWVGWAETVDGPRPVRFDHEPSQDELVMNNIRQNDKGRYEIKFFLATAVYNYAKDTIQCLEITQKGIQNEIYNLIQMPEYGNPTGYDIVISKTGEGLATEYSVTGMPPMQMGSHIEELVQKSEYDLTKLFSGEYPFASV